MGLENLDIDPYDTSLTYDPVSARNNPNLTSHVNRDRHESLASVSFGISENEQTSCLWNIF